MIVYVNTKSKRKKKKPDAKARALQSSWEEILRKYDVKTPEKSCKKSSSKVSSSPEYRRTVFDSASSVDSGVGLTPKKEILQYTGDEMIGIGQLHKSNAVPIFKQKDAEDLAKMRRG
jgi:hypothetical protein